MFLYAHVCVCVCVCVGVCGCEGGVFVGVQLLYNVGVNPFLGPDKPFSR